MSKEEKKRRPLIIPNPHARRIQQGRQIAYAVADPTTLPGERVIVGQQNYMVTHIELTWLGQARVGRYRALGHHFPHEFEKEWREHHNGKFVNHYPVYLLYIARLTAGGATTPPPAPQASSAAGRTPPV